MTCNIQYFNVTKVIFYTSPSAVSCQKLVSGSWWYRYENINIAHVYLMLTVTRYSRNSSIEKEKERRLERHCNDYLIKRQLLQLTVSHSHIHENSRKMLSLFSNSVQIKVRSALAFTKVEKNKRLNNVIVNNFFKIRISNSLSPSNTQLGTYLTSPSPRCCITSL